MTNDEFKKKIGEFFTSKNLGKRNLIKITTTCGVQNLALLVELFGEKISVPIDDYYAVVNFKTGVIFKAFDTGMSEMQLAFDKVEEQFKAEIIRRMEDPK